MLRCCHAGFVHLYPIRSRRLGDSAMAETSPAPQVLAYRCKDMMGVPKPGSENQPSRQAACTAAVVAYDALIPGCSFTGTLIAPNYWGADCEFTRIPDVPRGCYPGFAGHCLTEQYGTMYACPSGQGWALSGTNCTRADCTAGQLRDMNRVCYTPTDGTCTLR